MSQAKLMLPYEQLATLCKRYHIRRLALIRIQDELSQLFGGRSVDLVTLKFLNHRIRAQILAEAEDIYA